MLQKDILGIKYRHETKLCVPIGLHFGQKTAQHIIKYKFFRMSRRILKLVFLPLIDLSLPEQVALVHPITPEASEGWKAMCQVQHGGEVGKI